MTDFMTPRGHLANLVAQAKSATPFGEVGVCPLMQTTIHLLPVRYGLVEDGLDPSADLAMPYTLQSRPLGLRMLRDGYLYVIDSATGLNEYSIKQGSLEHWLFDGKEVKEDHRTLALGDPPEMIFSKSSVLHVAYSEVQWTVAKCRQVLDSATEREHFMQCIDLAPVNSEHIVAPLLHERHAKKWLAEVVQDHDAPHQGLTPEENIPYLWEHPPLFRQTLIEELTSQVSDDHKSDFLFLAVRDDIGVMRDLANYQDKVVGWIDDWARSGQEAGHTERDYLLGCYIESLSQISAAHLSKMAESTDDPALKALLLDLEKLPEPQRGETRQALLEVLSLDPVANPLPDASDSDLPADLKAQLKNIQARPARTYGYMVNELKKTVELYYLKQNLATADPDFVATHWQTLVKLHREQDKRLRDLLYGARWGQRGINDLIDRPRMDAFLKAQRPKLAHWNTLLDRITHDRLEMLTLNRFHRAAWYYDTNDLEQIDHALLTQYDCLKDLCRSDTAYDTIVAWLNRNPQQSRALFFTLPLSVQTELAAQFALFTNAGWGLLKSAPEWIEKLKTLFAGHLPDIETLPHPTQVNATAAWGTLAPAVQWGVQQGLHDFMQALDKGQMPDIEALFRYLPKTFGVSLLDAARREKVSFQIADADDLKALGETVKEVQAKRRYLRSLNNNARRYRAEKDHWLAQELENQRPETQQKLNVLEERLARMLSPIRELPEGAVHLQTATAGTPGLALVFPPEQQAQMRSLLDNYRQGVRVAPTAGLLGDGAGVLVFAAQLVNFVQVWKEVMAQPEQKRDTGLLWGPFFTTAAAGFGAAQGIADTALSAHAAQLGRNLKVAELKGIHVQMGKLHIGLGIVGYSAGMVAALTNLNISHDNWLNATREGNAGAQAGAALSMVGNSGAFFNNAYGVQQSGVALRNILAVIWQPEARATAWAVSGPRLATVFFRFNVAGILITALELSGTWFYNRYNLSRHDRWLQTTPWSQDPDRRLSLPLSEYQKSLHVQVKAPKIVVWPEQPDNQGTQPATRIVLHLPTTSSADLMKPFGNSKAKTVLRIGGYEVRTHTTRVNAVERWTVATDALIQKLQIKQATPLVLEFEAPTRKYRPTATERDELVVTVELGDFSPEDGVYLLNVYQFRVPLDGQGGEIADKNLEPQGEKCTFYLIDPLHLPQEDD
ncbi:hypothetical protein RGU44_23285 [Pseudomonas sp. 5C2]|uniref:toxin VasX n=1 Tax=Pseudomonas sp. 5C2 TaxID=3048588 RepID=UPI002AB38579|nr:toxin VasX [Pseudomonas sp. 5C2]MDY7567950.1 hypothetical protein [Pseudomonas sp. 5C2]